jgi:CRP-like cAMP-binding protein
MSETSHLKTYKAGETIFQKGDPGDLMYIIKSGSVEILVGDKIVELLGPDEFFGEMALIDQQPRSANAVAKTDCDIETITDKKFMFRVQEMPFFALKVMKIMAQRLRNTTARTIGS